MQYRTFVLDAVILLAVLVVTGLHALTAARGGGWASIASVVLGVLALIVLGLAVRAHIRAERRRIAQHAAEVLRGKKGVS